MTSPQVRHSTGPGPFLRRKKGEGRGGSETWPDFISISAAPPIHIHPVRVDRCGLPKENKLDLLTPEEVCMGRTGGGLKREREGGYTFSGATYGGEDRPDWELGVGRGRGRGGETRM